MNVKSKENKENSAIELVIEVSAAEFDAAINNSCRALWKMSERTRFTGAHS